MHWKRRREITSEIHLHRAHREAEIRGAELSIAESHMTDCNHAIMANPSIVEVEVTVDGEIALIAVKLCAT
jgi:hypothetical protein